MFFLFLLFIMITPITLKWIFLLVEIWIQNKKTERILWSDQFFGQEFHSTFFLAEKKETKKTNFFAANHIRPMLFNTQNYFLSFFLSFILSLLDKQFSFHYLFVLLLCGVVIYANGWIKEKLFDTINIIIIIIIINKIIIIEC